MTHRHISQIIGGDVMSFGYCDDERDHRRRAERDAEWNRPDRDYYDRYTSDPCKQAYTEAYDREQREIRQREYEHEEQEREARSAQRRQMERELEYEPEEQPYAEPVYDEYDRTEGAERDSE